jgi:hypothetical protein
MMVLRNDRAASSPSSRRRLAMIRVMRRWLWSLRVSHVGADRVDLVARQDRGVRLGAAARREREQPLDVIVHVLERGIVEGEHVAQAAPAPVRPEAGEEVVQSVGWLHGVYPSTPGSTANA